MAPSDRHFSLSPTCSVLPLSRFGSSRICGLFSSFLNTAVHSIAMIEPASLVPAGCCVIAIPKKIPTETMPKRHTSPAGVIHLLRFWEKARNERQHMYPEPFLRLHQSAS